MQIQIVALAVLIAAPVAWGKHFAVKEVSAYQMASSSIVMSFARSLNFAVSASLLSTTHGVPKNTF
jgi:hypothetical protein